MKAFTGNAFNVCLGKIEYSHIKCVHVRFRPQNTNKKAFFTEGFFIAVFHLVFLIAIT